jgi:hypothetical protein
MPIFERNLPLLTPNLHTQNRFDSTESKYWTDRRTDGRTSHATTIPLEPIHGLRGKNFSVAGICDRIETTQHFHVHIFWFIDTGT